MSVAIGRTERASARLGGVTARRMTGKRPVGARHTHAQRAARARRVNGRVAQARTGNGHVTGNGHITGNGCEPEIVTNRKWSCDRK